MWPKWYLKTTSVNTGSRATLAYRKIFCTDQPILFIDLFPPKDYKPEWDPSKFKSEKTGRGPLIGPWKVSYRKANMKMLR